MKQKQSVTLAFGAVQATFWMSLCVAISFAEPYLTANGFSYTEFGLVMAVGNVVGSLSGPMLASLAEKRGLATAALIWPLFALRVLCLVALGFCAGRSLVCAGVYALYLAGMIAVNSLNMKYCVDAAQQARPLDYSKARAAGSLAYVLLAALLGELIERLQPSVLLWAAGVVLLLQAASTFWIASRLRGSAAADRPNAAQTKSASLPAFLRSEPRFALFLLGAVLLYFSHNSITNYMLKIVRNVGGSESTMGYINAVMAMVEIPVMLLFGLLLRRWRVSLLLQLSVAAFLLKALAFAFAPSIPLLFASLLLQAPSFALFTCAVVPYVNKVIAPQNAAKAQSLAFSITTLGAVGASLLSGRLFDLWEVQPTLLVAAAACAVGVAICVPAVKKTD